MFFKESCSEEVCPATLKLTLTLTGGQFSSGSIIRIPFETRKPSFISAFSIFMTVPYVKMQHFKRRALALVFVLKKTDECMKIYKKWKNNCNKRYKKEQ